MPNNTSVLERTVNLDAINYGKSELVRASIGSSICLKTMYSMIDKDGNTEKIGKIVMIKTGDDHYHIETKKSDYVPTFDRQN